MSVSHLFYIFYDRLGELSVCVESFIFPSRVTHPRTHMNFIDRHRILLMIPCLPRFHPCVIRPSYTGKIRNTRRRSRTKLRIICKRIRLIKKLAFLRLNTELIELSFFRFRYKLHINTERLLTLHSVSFQIPVIKFPDYRHILRIRRPYREINALRFVVHYFMCA